MRKTKFANDHFYHIYNRGTEKRDIFLDKSDHFRFIRYLYELNNFGSTEHLTRRIGRGRASTNKRPRDLLVEIIAFCLMPNHFHLTNHVLRLPFAK